MAPSNSPLLLAEEATTDGQRMAAVSMDRMKDILGHDDSAAAVAGITAVETGASLATVETDAALASVTAVETDAAASLASRASGASGVHSNDAGDSVEGAASVDQAEAADPADQAQASTVETSNASHSSNATNASNDSNDANDTDNTDDDDTEAEDLHILDQLHDQLRGMSLQRVVRGSMEEEDIRNRSSSIHTIVVSNTSSSNISGAENTANATTISNANATSTTSNAPQNAQDTQDLPRNWSSESLLSLLSFGFQDSVDLAHARNVHLLGQAASSAPSAPSARAAQVSDDSLASLSLGYQDSVDLAHARHDRLVRPCPAGEARQGGQGGPSIEGNDSLSSLSFGYQDSVDLAHARRVRPLGAGTRRRSSRNSVGNLSHMSGVSGLTMPSVLSGMSGMSSGMSSMSRRCSEESEASLSLFDCLYGSNGPNVNPMNPMMMMGQGQVPGQGQGQGPANQGHTTGIQSGQEIQCGPPGQGSTLSSISFGSHPSQPSHPSYYRQGSHGSNHSSNATPHHPYRRSSSSTSKRRSSTFRRGSTDSAGSTSMDSLFSLGMADSIDLTHVRLNTDAVEGFGSSYKPSKKNSKTVSANVSTSTNESGEWSEWGGHFVDGEGATPSTATTTVTIPLGAYLKRSSMINRTPLNRRCSNLAILPENNEDDRSDGKSDGKSDLDGSHRSNHTDVTGEFELDDLEALEAIDDLDISHRSNVSTNALDASHKSDLDGSHRSRLSHVSTRTERSEMYDHFDPYEQFGIHDFDDSDDDGDNDDEEEGYEIFTSRLPWNRVPQSQESHESQDESQGHTQDNNGDRDEEEDILKARAALTTQERIALAQRLYDECDDYLTSAERNSGDNHKRNSSENSNNNHSGSSGWNRRISVESDISMGDFYSNFSGTAKHIHGNGNGNDIGRQLKSSATTRRPSTESTDSSFTFGFQDSIDLNHVRMNKHLNDTGTNGWNRRISVESDISMGDFHSNFGTTAKNIHSTGNATNASHRNQVHSQQKASAMMRRGSTESSDSSFTFGFHDSIDLNHVRLDHPLRSINLTNSMNPMNQTSQKFNSMALRRMSTDSNDSFMFGFHDSIDLNHVRLSHPNDPHHPIHCPEEEIGSERRVPLNDTSDTHDTPDTHCKSSNDGNGVVSSTVTVDTFQQGAQSFTRSNSAVHDTPTSSPAIAISSSMTTPTGTIALDSHAGPAGPAGPATHGGPKGPKGHNGHNGKRRSTFSAPSPPIGVTNGARRSSLVSKYALHRRMSNLATMVEEEEGQGHSNEIVDSHGMKIKGAVENKMAVGTNGKQRMIASDTCCSTREKGNEP